MRKEYYDTYKSLGICTCCGKEKAEEGKVLCKECGKKDAQRVKNYDKERKAQYSKRKKELCDAFGVCTTCMKRDKYKGKQCKECYDKRVVKYKEKQEKNGIVPREERLFLDVCVICGEPVEEGYTLCKKHLEIARGNIAKGREAKVKQEENKSVKLSKEERIEIKNKYRRRKRDLCKAFGVCTRCMNRDAHKGVLCIDCYLKSKSEYRKTQLKKGIIPVSLRKGMGLCYICGEPVEEGYHLCSKHLKIARENIDLARKKMLDGKDTHPWVIANRVYHIKRQYLYSKGGA